MRDGPGWRVLELDEVEGRPWVGTELTWLPLREELGTRIIGMAAFTSERVGQEVVEDHSEAEGGRGHEEVYIVLRGRASFTLDGEELDAPAGTFVLVSDPNVHRRAVAAQADTAVLALGGLPTFEPSASEWIERARPHLRTDPARARRIVDELHAARPDSAGVDIAEALLAVGRGDCAAADELLAGVLAEEPALRGTLERDPDLGPLLRDPG
jgi:mannose-6-phosphate isomerase-like protein (cupin superfamily)